MYHISKIMESDFTAVLIGGVPAILITQPFDMIKNIEQTQNNCKPTISSTTNTFKQIFAENGIRGIYRGVGYPIAGLVIGTSITHSVLKCMQLDNKELQSLKKCLIAGSITGLTQSVVSTHIDFIEAKMQLQSLKKPLYTNWLYRNLGITVARDIARIPSCLIAYEIMTRNDNSNKIQTLMAGGAAGVISSIISHPVDVIKSILQADGIYAPQQYANAVDCANRILARESWRAFTRGWKPAMMGALVSNAVFFSITACYIKKL